MKSAEFVKEVRGLSLKDMQNKTRSIAEELMKLRFRKASGQTEHGMRIRLLKRDLARVETIVRQQQKQAAAK